jgi:hypothetical protein
MTMNIRKVAADVLYRAVYCKAIVAFKSFGVPREAEEV